MQICDLFQKLPHERIRFQVQKYGKQLCLKLPIEKIRFQLQKIEKCFNSKNEPKRPLGALIKSCEQLISLGKPAFLLGFHLILIFHQNPTLHPEDLWFYLSADVDGGVDRGLFLINFFYIKKIYSSYIHLCLPIYKWNLCKMKFLWD